MTSIATMGIGGGMGNAALLQREHFKTIQFIEADVRAYCALFQQQYTGKVPVLMCATMA